MWDKKENEMCTKCKRTTSIEEERFGLDTSLAIFCHPQMTKEYCFIFTSFKAYRWWITQDINHETSKDWGRILQQINWAYPYFKCWNSPMQDGLLLCLTLRICPSVLQVVRKISILLGKKPKYLKNSSFSSLFFMFCSALKNEVP